MSTPTTPADLFITVGTQRRTVALATGLPLGSQRIDHMIWLSRLLRQGKGVAAITSSDALHDFGMSRKQWELFSAWIRDEGWAQVEKAYGQGFVWSYGPKWDATDWPAITELYRDAIATALQDSVLPGLKQHIVSSRVTTPQDFQDRLWSFKGAGFGLEPVITQSAWFRPHNRSEDIPNLFLVGAGTQPCAGVPSVLMSAKMLEQVVPHALTVY